MLNRSDESQHPSLVLLLILEQSSQSFIIKYHVSCGVFVGALYQIVEVPFYS